MKTYRASRSLILLVCLASLLTGCWDYSDIETRAFVLGLGVDLDKASPDGGYLLTVEIPHTTSSQMQGPTPGGGGGGEPKLVADATGKTVADATVALGKKLPLTPAWGQIISVVISEEVAREGINHILDIFIRGVRLNIRARLFVVEGSAGEAFAHQSTSQPVTSQVLRLMEHHFDYYPRFAKPNPLHEAKRPINEGPTLLPRLVMEGGELIISGAAVMREGSMVGWLDEETAEGANWLLGDVKRSHLILPCPGSPNSSIALELRSKGRRIKFRQTEPVAQFHFELAAHARIMDMANCPLSPVTVEDRRKIEADAEAALNKRAMRAITRAQDELGVDFLGLDVYLQRHAPRVWRELDWELAFPQVRVTVGSDITITDPGSINREARL